MQNMRLFIAIELPPEVKAALGSLETQLKKGGHRFVKWVDPENIHITLKFLGATPVEDIKGITEALATVAQRTEPLFLHLGGLGCFPNWQRPQIIWVGLGGEIEKLADLQRDVETVMYPLGFDRESRVFVPHLTIARIKGGSRQDIQAFGENVSTTEFAEDLDIEVDELNLIESTLTRSGPIYSCLAAATLIGKS